jgi:hypothetical protein
MSHFTSGEEKFIREAAEKLENPSFIARLADLIGKPVEKGIAMLPEGAREMLNRTSREAIEGALKTALFTLDERITGTEFREAVGQANRTRLLHGVSTAITGAAGGFFGLPALVVELPVTTTVILRSIAQIAADFGEDLSTREAQLDCLYVFSLGSPSPADDDMDSAYYTSRIAFANLIHQAVKFLGGRSAQEILRAVERKTAPVLVELIVRVAARFEIVVGNKAMGQLIPGIGAGAGALINLAFTEYFSEVAKYHFGLKRLERDHGDGEVKQLYDRMRLELSRSRKAIP